MKKELTETQITLLKTPLPKEAVTQHPTKTYLSSIKAIFVVERLNAVFGIGSWTLKSTIIANNSDMIVVQSVLTIPDYGIELESYGGNDNGGEANKNFDLGDAYKGATTDAMTKICSYLEIGIDVFKGTSKASTPQTPGSDGNLKPSLPWLNVGTPEFDKAKDFISKGGDVKDIRKKYAISTKTLEALK
jgi:hypothetical protein